MGRDRKSCARVIRAAELTEVCEVAIVSNAAHQGVLRVGMLTGQGMSRDGREYENTVEMHDKWT